MDKLTLYNDALLICGERFLASLSEEREPRRLLDHVWDKGAVKTCLARGQWKFAMRTVRLDYDPDITTDFGFTYAFLKPSDWVNTSSLCTDEYFRDPLTRYEDEAGYWYADVDQLFIRYISNDAAYGGDMGNWPVSFSDYIAAYMARNIILKLTGDKEKVKTVFALEKDLLLTAENSDAMNGPSRSLPPGSWVKARSRSSNRYRDGGSNSSLIG